MFAVVTSAVCLCIFVQTHRSKAGQGVQSALRFSITLRPLINVKFGSHIKKKPGIAQKIRNDRVDEYFGRKWSKCRKVIFAHSLGNTMGAMGGRALAPMLLHPLQYGVANLGRVYWLIRHKLIHTTQKYCRKFYHLVMLPQLNYSKISCLYSFIMRNSNVCAYIFLFFHIFLL